MGTHLPPYRNPMETHDPFLFVALRFSIAALFLLPYFFKNLTKEQLTAGVILGFLNCAAYVTQTIGLQTVNASREAFITGINVICIPFLAPLFKMQSPTRYDFISAGMCCLGIFILTGCDLSRLTIGDGWVLLCAICVAISITYIGRLSKIGFDPYLLTSSQIIATALFSWVLCLFFAEIDFNAIQNHSFISTLLYCSIFATVLAIGLQTVFQKYVSAQKAAIIFCLEPVFAAIFDVFINSVKLDLYTILGGAVILLSIAILELTKDSTEPQTL